MFARRKRKKTAVFEVDINEEGDLIPWSHWIGPEELRLNVPVKLLVMQGGFDYGDEHPFVAALSKGRPALEAFYKSCQPLTIAEYYGFVGDRRLGHDLPPWELPWYARSKRLPPPGESGLGPEHGVSFYGPATPQKIDLEMMRLQGAAASIEKRGFKPDQYDDIRGYVLGSGSKARFFVRGGKHRAAVLYHLGYTHIPVAFRQNFPRLVSLDQAGEWPLVSSKQMDESLARDIFGRYFSS
ncbi:MAG: hypothetical protein AAGA88_02045 [Pseudomonadota bacterium]